jgi:hypothetical protein
LLFCEKSAIDRGVHKEVSGVSDISPDLTMLPLPQRALWRELGATPEAFTHYGGTAFALRLGHRTSVDFDCFDDVPALPGAVQARLAAAVAAVDVTRLPVLTSYAARPANDGYPS